ncbi:MAG: hypothetical protein ABSD74_10990 [Rhizomicrobium sp.]|jgi:hypothetical protein
MIRELVGMTLVLCRPAYAAQAQTMTRQILPTVCSTTPTEDAKILCGDLSKFNEPAVPLMSSNVQSFRLMYLRSFDPKIIIRFDTQANDTIVMTAKEITIVSPRDGEIVESLGLNRTVLLSGDEETAFRSAIRKADFWNARTQYHLDWNLGAFTSPPPKKDAVVMNDGAIWFLEGMTASRYHVMLDDGGAFASPLSDVGLTMLRIAKKRLPELDVFPTY